MSSLSPSAGDPTPTPENPPPPVVRKFPAPCWTQDETLALIHVYQDKWYSLRRRNLRTADWEAVADEVNRRCPDQSPPKSSAQCRHKMEKLRKRYRAEKQRIGALPCHNNFVSNRFFPSSSWVFFDLMDAMEVGSGSGSASGSVSLVVNNNHNHHNNNNNNPNVNVMKENNGGFVKEEKKKDDLGKYFDEILMGMGKNTGTGSGVKFKVKNHSDRLFDESKYEGYDYDGGTGNGSGFDYGKSGRSFVSGFNKRKVVGGGVGERFGEDSSSKMVLNGSSSSKRGGGMGSGSGSGSGSRARGGDAVLTEMVASIKMLGEGLVRMEKMKMEMMQEIERNRMEMEMKRNEMILESQHNIVNAFVQGFKKHKKGHVKVMQID